MMRLPQVDTTRQVTVFFSYAKQAHPIHMNAAFAARFNAATVRGEEMALPGQKRRNEVQL
jgi:hypothetical protein